MRREQICGWLALGLSTLIACLWAFWGIIENFHEGFWSPQLSQRLLGTLAYMSLMLICMALTLLALRWPRLGAVAMFLGGAWFTWFIFSQRRGHLDLGVVLSWLPVTLLVVGVGLLWWWGRPRPLKLAYLIALSLPWLTALCCGIGPAWRVCHRVDDGVTAQRLVPGNGVSLVWAPEGPGWVRDAKHSVNWDQARDICSRLSADGLRLEVAPVGIWRLPTVEEAVRSLTRNGKNAGGVWDANAKRATYRITPDKESPLWRVYAETIYWWTGTAAGPDKAYRLVYDGQVFATRKSYRLGSVGFRAVREP
jgi:hypothetical protein